MDPVLVGGDADELGMLGRVLEERVGLELPERELIRAASLVLDGLRDEGFEVVSTYPSAAAYTVEAVADDG